MAQQWEKDVWRRYSTDGEDWNPWWAQKFSGYEFLKGRKILSMLEVGCGPWAKNTIIILGVIGNDKRVVLEDPLLDDYISTGKTITKLNAERFSVPLEELVLPVKVDLVVCINVLDHVYSVGLCMDAIFRSLNREGIVIVGQDLTNDEDVSKTPNADVGHPVRIEASSCMEHLSVYRPIYQQILPRETGRNPSAHYGTLLFAGEKL